MQVRQRLGEAILMIYPWLILLVLCVLAGCSGDGGKGKHSDRDRPLPVEESKQE